MKGGLILTQYEGLEIATELITRICGGQASKFVVSGKYSQKNKTIKLQIDKFESVIGISISANDAVKILTSLEFKCKKSKKELIVEVPSWRPDILQDIDLIEDL